MTFKEAYKAMQEGKKVKRPTFKGYWFINQEDGIFSICLANGKIIQYGKLDITVKNTVADDWEVVPEEPVATEEVKKETKKEKTTK